MLAAARGLQFAAAMILLGSSLFPFYARPAAPDSAQIKGVVRRFQAIAALATLVSALAWVAVSIMDVAEDVRGLFDPETLSQYFLETSFGRVWALRLLAAALLAAVALAAPARLFERSGAAVLVAALAAALLASQAWIGHPASLPVSERWPVTAAYALHVVGAAVWIGALPPLGLLVARALRQGEGLAAAELALRRFSLVGMVAVASILLGGVVNALSRAPSSAAFVDSGWGRIVLFKSAVVFAMIVAAARNRFVLTPRLSSAHPEASLAELARNVAFEQTAGIVVLAASSLLAIFHPPGMHHP